MQDSSANNKRPLQFPPIQGGQFDFGSEGAGIDSLKDWVKGGWSEDPFVVPTDEHGNQIKDFPGGSGLEFFYRGQADATHFLTSSLYREVKNHPSRKRKDLGAPTSDPAGSDVPDDVAEGAANGRSEVSDKANARPSSSIIEKVTEVELAAAENRAIAAIRAQGVGRNLRPIELLAVLQHHGVPTRLLDVSRTRQEALFFATDRGDQAEGRMFIIQAKKVDVDEFEKEMNKIIPVVDGEESAGSSTEDERLPWSGVARGEKYQSSGWTQYLRVIDAGRIDPRIIAQGGLFIVGSLNRSIEGRQYPRWELVVGKDGRRVVQRCKDEKNVESARMADLSSMPLQLLSRAEQASKIINGSWPARAWTFTFPGEWKPKLREWLREEFQIDADHIYPPIDSVDRLAKYAISIDIKSESSGD